METLEAVEVVHGAAKLADGSPRVVACMEIGQAVRQGDVYLHAVGADHPRGKIRVGEESRQLAVGSQVNARHVAEPPAVVYEGSALPPTCAAGTFLGPLVVSDAPFVVSHPEHAAICLPAGVYQITHQVDIRTLERVRD